MPTICTLNISTMPLDPPAILSKTRQTILPPLSSKYSMPAMKTSIGTAPSDSQLIIPTRSRTIWQTVVVQDAGYRRRSGIGLDNGGAFIERNDRDPEIDARGGQASWGGAAGLCNRPIKRDRGPLAREFGNYGPVLMTSDPTRGVKRRERWRGGWLATRGEAWPCRVTACNELEPWTRRLLLPSSTIPFYRRRCQILADRLTLSQGETSLTPDTHLQPPGTRLHLDSLIPGLAVAPFSPRACFLRRSDRGRFSRLQSIL